MPRLAPGPGLHSRGSCSCWALPQRSNMISGQLRANPCLHFELRLGSMAQCKSSRPLLMLSGLVAGSRYKVVSGCLVLEGWPQLRSADRLAQGPYPNPAWESQVGGDLGHLEQSAGGWTATGHRRARKLKQCGHCPTSSEKRNPRLLWRWASLARAGWFGRAQLMLADKIRACPADITGQAYLML